MQQPFPTAFTLVYFVFLLQPHGRWWSWQAISSPILSVWIFCAKTYVYVHGNVRLAMKINVNTIEIRGLLVFLWHFPPMAKNANIPIFIDILASMGSTNLAYSALARISFLLYDPQDLHTLWGIISAPHLLHFTKLGADIFQFALLLSLLDLEDLFFGQIDILFHLLIHSQ